jgi:hypothetical protein
MCVSCGARVCDFGKLFELTRSWHILQLASKAQIAAHKKRKALKAESKRLLSQSPDADTQLKQLFKLLCHIEYVAGYTPALVGDSAQW